MIYNEQTRKIALEVAKKYEEFTGNKFLEMHFDYVSREINLYYENKIDRSNSFHGLEFYKTEILDEMMNGFGLEINFVWIEEKQYDENDFTLNIVDGFTIVLLTTEILIDGICFDDNGTKHEITFIVDTYDLKDLKQHLSHKQPYLFFGVATVQMTLSDGSKKIYKRKDYNNATEYFNAITERLRYKNNRKKVYQI